MRAGRVGDAGAAAVLIRDAGDRHMDVLVGQGTRVGTEGVVGALWATGGTRFSAQHAVVAESEDRVVGLLICYPHEAMQALNRATGVGLLRRRGIGVLAAALTHPQLTWALARMPESQPGDWYISTLATTPGMRGQGIGSALLHDAQSQAQAAGARALSLVVAEEPTAARRLYRGVGFTVRTRFLVAGHASVVMAKAL